MAAPTITLDAGPETDAGAAHDADPFGLEPELRRRVLPAARFLYERYWRGVCAGRREVVRGSIPVASVQPGFRPPRAVARRADRAGRDRRSGGDLPARRPRRGGRQALRHAVRPLHAILSAPRHARHPSPADEM